MRRYSYTNRKGINSDFSGYEPSLKVRTLEQHCTELKTQLSALEEKRTGLALLLSVVSFLFLGYWALTLGHFLAFLLASIALIITYDALDCDSLVFGLVVVFPIGLSFFK